MKTKIAICYLAYGDEHISEFNHISKNILSIDNFNIFVCTNDKSKIIENVTIIETDELFNYNLKRKSIETALKNFNIILFMDTDYHIINTNMDFSFLNDLKDGIYVNWINDSVNFMNNILRCADFSDKYFDKLQKLNTTNKKLFFIDECVFLLKISDENTKINFIKNWNNIFNETEDVQPSNGNNGAIEGIIIYLSCILSNITVYKSVDYKYINNLFNKFYHYSKEINKNFYNTKKTLI